MWCPNCGGDYGEGERCPVCGTRGTETPKAEWGGDSDLEAARKWPRGDNGEPETPVFLAHCSCLNMEDVLMTNLLMAYDIPVIKIMTGSIQKKINQDNLNNYKIPQIPHEIANQFTSMLKIIFSKLRAIEIENSELTKLRDWLLPMLMNGQARVE